MSPRSSARRWPDPTPPLAAAPPPGSAASACRTLRRHAATLATAALLALTLAAAPVAAEPAGEVRFVAGNAQLSDAAGRQKSLAAGAELQAGDRIVTGAGGLVQFRLSDGSLVLVRGDSDVAIESYRFREVADAGALLHLKLAKGVLRAQTGAVASRNAAAYRVVTPTATIASRGADHEPAFIPEPRWGKTPVAPPGTYDRVHSGATVIEAFGSRIEVLPGQVGFAAAGAHAPPQILPAPPDFLRAPAGSEAVATPIILLPGVMHRHRLPRAVIVPGAVPARPEARAGEPGSAGMTGLPPSPTAPATAARPVISPLPGPVISPLSAPVVSPLPGPVVSPLVSPVVVPLGAPLVAPMAAPVVPPPGAPVTAPNATRPSSPPPSSPSRRDLRGSP